MSCPTATWCAALLEYYQTGVDSPSLAAEVWSGGSWSSPTYLTSQSFAGAQSLSCSATGRCIALDGDDGQHLSSLSGGSWATVPVSTIADGVLSVATAVSCAGDGSCLVIGRDDSSSQVALQYSGGTWSASAVPVPAQSSSIRLNAVSCVGHSDCTAVGSAKDSATGSSSNLAAHFDGQGWTFATLPASGPSGVVPSSVSCPSTGVCAALESGDNAVDVLAGGTWTATSLPSPTGQDPSSGDVSCGSDGACVVVGSSNDFNNVAGAAWQAQLHGAGTSWTEESVALPAPRDVSLDGIGCSSPDRCVALGLVNTVNGAELGVESGTKPWQYATAPVDPDASEPQGVACATRSLCIGTLVDRYSTTPFEAVSGHGNAWSTTRLPTPAAAAAGTEMSISAPVCPSSNECFAAVGFLDQHYTPYVGIETWRSGTWTYSPIPVAPPRSAGSLNSVFGLSVSCASAEWCTVVGNADYNNFGSGAAFADTFEKGTWDAVVAPQPPEPNGELEALSCPVVGWCLATGRNANNADDAFNSVAETYSSGTWHTITLAIPSSLENQDLSAVDCVAESRCLAVGEQTAAYSGSNKQQVQALVATLSGAKWSRLALADASGTDQSQLTGVACPSTGDCYAVGSADGKDGGFYPVATRLSAPALPAPSNAALMGEGEGAARLTWTNPPGATGSAVTLTGCVSHRIKRVVAAGVHAELFRALTSGRPCAATVRSLVAGRTSEPVSASARVTSLKLHVANTNDHWTIGIHGSPDAKGWSVRVLVAVDSGRTSIHRVTLDEHGSSVLQLTLRPRHGVHVVAVFRGRTGELGARDTVSAKHRPDHSASN